MQTRQIKSWLKRNLGGSQNIERLSIKTTELNLDKYNKYNTIQTT